MKHYDVCLNNRLTVGDVYLMGSSGVYDIELPDRLTEGEIIIYNIPFRMSFAGENGIVLDEAVLGTLLRDLIRVEPGVVLGAQVDGTLETNFETVLAGIPLDARIAFLGHYAVEPKAIGVVLQAGMDTFAQKTTGGESGLMLSVDPVEAIVGKSLGAGESSFVLDSSVIDYDIYGTVRGDVGIAVLADILGEHIDMAERVAAGVEMGAEVSNVLGTVRSGGETGLAIDVSSLDAFVHSPLGGGETALVIAAEVLPDGENLIGLLALETSVNVKAEMAEVARVFLEPMELSIGMAASMTIANGHYRILEELDPNSMASYDAMTIADVDFEEIDG